MIRIGHPLLRKSCRDIVPEECGSKKFGGIIRKMIRTMRAYEGVGLAANQVALDMKLVVMECQSSRRYPDSFDFALEVWINPRILRVSKETVSDWEGCLSIPGYRGIVPRAREVTFEAWTPKGEKVQKTVRGFHARVMQHETDHLIGKVYIDRMPDLKQWVHLETFNKLMHTHVKDRVD